MPDIVRIDQNARRSRAVIHGDMIYLAGQVADDTTGGIADQTGQALAKVDAMLAQAGSDKTRLLSATIWLRSMDDFDGMNAVWDKWVAPGHAPARCCGSDVALAGPGCRVEIMVVAAR